jgi:3-methyladenine DNA glycosylase AlkD
MASGRKRAEHDVAVAAAVGAAQAALRAAADPAKAPGRKAYLKTDLEVLGCTLPNVRAAARAVKRAHHAPARDEIVAALTALWASPVHDDRVLAVILAGLYARLFDAGDVAGWLRDWLADCRTWDLVDGLSTFVVGEIALRDAAAWPVIDGWSRDPWMWLRRAAVLAHVPAIRQGALRRRQFRDTCRRLVDEREFFIRKAIGWALREIATRDPDLVEALLADFGARASGLTLREATRRLPPERRAVILAKLER